MYTRTRSTPALSLPGDPGLPGNHRGSSQTDSLLKCRALEGWPCWRSLSACAAQGWVSTASPTGLCSPCSHRLGQGTPEHSSWMFLSTSMAPEDLTWFRSGSLLGSALVRVQHCRRRAASLCYCCFHSALNTREKPLRVCPLKWWTHTNSVQENNRAAHFRPCCFRNIFAYDGNIPSISRSIKFNSSAVQGSNSMFKFGAAKGNK